MSNRIKGITVEIGGDTTKLQTALKGVNGEIRNTQSQLRDVEKLLKLDPGNTDLLAQKHKLLAQAVAETKEKLETLKTAQEQANQALSDGSISQEQYDGSQREIIETEQALEQLEEQADQSAVALQKIAATGEKVQTAGGAVSGVGKKLMPVTAALTAVGGASAKMATDFEDAMAKVSTIADTGEVPMDELKKSIIALSNQTGISSTEIAQNVYDAISAGQSTGDAVNFVSNSTKLAKAGFAEAGDSLDILTTIMNAYGLEASEVTDVSDMLIQTQNLGKTTVGELSTAMGKVIPTANAYGVELDQLCAGYALMTSNGVATAESITYMNSMLNELGKSGTTVSDTLKDKTGSSFSELMTKGYSLSDCLAIVKDTAAEQGLSFGDMWSSSEAAKAGLILLGDSAEDFNSTLSQMQDSTGATDSAFNKLKTNSYTIQVAINQLKNTAIELGTAIMQVLAPIIISLAEKISALTTWFSGLSDGTKRTIVTIGMIVAAVGPVLIVIGKVMGAVGTIMTVVPKIAGVIHTVKTAFAALNVTMLANPIVLIIAAIAALVAAFIYLWNNCEGFREFWISLWENVKQVAIAAWNALKEFFSAVVTAISTFLSAAWNTIKSVITTVLNGIQAVITTAWNAIKTTISTVVNAIKTVIAAVWDAIKTVITTVLTGIQSTVASVWNSIRSCIGKIKDAVGDVAQTIKSFLHFSVPDEGPLTDYESWMPDFMSGLADGINKSKAMVAKAVNGVASDMIINSKVNTAQMAMANGADIGFADTGTSIVSAIRDVFSEMNNQSGDIVIPVYVGGTLLDEIVVGAQARQNLRSGGR